VKVAVTGADGFVGRHLVPRLMAEGHTVVAAIRPGATSPWRPPEGVQVIPLELTDDASVGRLASDRPEGVIHLAAVASGADARREPGVAWSVNAAGTARLAEHLARLRTDGAGDPQLVLVSTAEVYGNAEPTPRVETDPAEPVSPYAASKLGAEIAGLEVHRRTGLRVVIARPFPHSGPGQDERFVLPAFAHRLALAKRARAPVVKVGNLDVVREFLHVADVIEAYVALLSKGRSGAVYNVAGGRGLPLAEVFDRLARLIGHRAVPETDPALVRRGDIAYLVGDATRLRVETGWHPKVQLEQLLQDVVDAQTD
jgi:GDP-4-dehydro-6-deoxy-D-mannose reductase